MAINSIFDIFKTKNIKERPVAERYDVAVVSMPADRPINEDFVGYKEGKKRLLVALADGLGGHGKGEEASKLAVENAEDLFNENGDINEMLAEMFQTAQDRVMARQLEISNTNVMKTTLVLGIVEDSLLYYGHIGDSRLYYFEDGKYKFHTLDHSVPQMLVSSGRIKEKDIRGHEDRNRLLRVIGTEWNDPRYEIAPKPAELRKGDAILLCSDGFWELITEKQMNAAFRASSSANEWVRKMEECILATGKNGSKNMDNYSAIAVIAK